MRKQVNLTFLAANSAIVSNSKKSFNFLEFKTKLVKQHGSGSFIIALDPSFIPKAGKSTPGLGYFWSGPAGRASVALNFWAWLPRNY